MCLNRFIIIFLLLLFYKFPLIFTRYIIECMFILIFKCSRYNIILFYYYTHIETYIKRCIKQSKFIINKIYTCTVTRFLEIGIETIIMAMKRDLVYYCVLLIKYNIMLYVRIILYSRNNNFKL